MAGIGDEITTSGGVTYVMVAKSTTVSAQATVATLAELLDQVNLNLNILIDTFRWAGNYDAREDSLEQNSERQEYDFKFPVRYIRLYATQPISIQLNDVGNPMISVDTSEMPFVLNGLTPGFTLQKIFATPGTLPTNIKILAMG
jgi:hypothetical protein